MKYKISKLKVVAMATYISICNTLNVYAQLDGTTQFDNTTNWVLKWIGKIGILVVIWGAVQIAFSISNEDAGQRRKGILELVSGLMIIAIGYGAKSIIGF